MPVFSTPISIMQSLRFVNQQLAANNMCMRSRLSAFTLKTVDYGIHCAHKLDHSLSIFTQRYPSYDSHAATFFHGVTILLLISIISTQLHVKCWRADAMWKRMYCFALNIWSRKSSFQWGKKCRFKKKKIKNH